MGEDLKKYRDSSHSGLNEKKLALIDGLTVVFCFFIVLLMKYTGLLALDIRDIVILLVVALFLCALPAFLLMSYLLKNQNRKETKLFLELASEEERYRLAFENSRDIIFEYDYRDGSLSCFGNFRSEDSDELNAGRIDGTLENLVLNDGKVFFDDVQKVVDFKNGKIDESFNIRIRNNEDEPFLWYKVEGTIVSDHERPMKLIGKLRNIDEEKKHERDFLDNAKKDDATGFFTWEVGKRLIEDCYEKRPADTMLVFFKLMNLSEIDEEHGAIFADAVIVQVANVLQGSTRQDEDTLIRINRESFAAILPGISQDGMMMMHTGIERQLEHMYTGAESEGGLDYIIRFISTAEELYKIVESEKPGEEQYKARNAGIRYDTVSFAFNILEHTKDINSAMGMLLEYVGTQYNIACIHVMGKEDTPGMETCLYSWRSGPTFFGVNQGDIREFDSVDMDTLYRELVANDYLVADSHVLSSMSQDTRARLLRNHTSHLYVAMISGGEAVGLVDYEHLNPEYNWPDEAKETLNEVTRVISTYVLKNKSDNASRAKSDFLSSMSHEIRTPMNAITGFSELILAEKGLNDNARKYAGDIKASSESLLAIINDILDFSKIEAGKFEIIPENYRLSSMLNDICSIIKVRIGEKGVSLNVILEGEIPDGLVGDVSRVKQIFLNIMNNAVKFTHKGSITLTLSWEEKDEDSGILHASVRDTGIGIREEDLVRIFDSFSQADTVRNKSIIGTGLGLAICKNLLNLMDGGIKADSVYGEGSEFTFYLEQGIFDNKKCVFDPENFKRDNSESFRVPFVAPEAKVLIVDDNRVNLEVAKGLLRQYRADIRTALSGEEALDIVFKENDFDIIFMDHMMPKMDGIETTAHIRHREIDKNTPIIALTANAIKGADKLFLDAGLNDYISKPIDLRHLAQVMEKWIPEEKKVFDYTDESAETDTQSEKAAESLNEAAQIASGDEFEALSGINTQAGLNNCLGDRNVYRDLLQTFIESDGWNVADGFYRDRDLENYRISVHGLKSAANYIGAMTLSAYAKQLEDYAKAEDTDAIDEHHQGLEALYNEVAVSIKALLGLDEAAEGAQDVRPEAEKGEIEGLVDDLIANLEEMELDSAGSIAEHIMELRSSNDGINDALKDICRDIDNFDFEEALEKAKKVKGLFG